MARRLPTVEVNGTFYGLTRPSACAAWRAAVPDGFVFAIKGSRFITHMLKLRKFETPLANFFASGLLRLGSALGPILWQLPPQLPFDEERARAFFAAVPRDLGDRRALGPPPRRADDGSRRPARRGGRARADPPCRRDPTRVVADRPRARDAARAGCGAGRGRHGRKIPAFVRTHRRLRVRPAPRLGDALHQPLQRRRGRGLGDAHQCLDRDGKRRVRLLRQRRPGARAPRRRPVAGSGRRAGAGRRPRVRGLSASAPP